MPPVDQMQQTPRRNEVSPSRHSPSCWIRWVTATRMFATAMPVLVGRSSGSSTRLPAMLALPSLAWPARITAPQVRWGTRRLGGSPVTYVNVMIPG
jgi:hypothetical protein